VIRGQRLTGAPALRWLAARPEAELPERHDVVGVRRLPAGVHRPLRRAHIHLPRGARARGSAARTRTEGEGTLLRVSRSAVGRPHPLAAAEPRTARRKLTHVRTYVDKTVYQYIYIYILICVYIRRH